MGSYTPVPGAPLPLFSFLLFKGIARGSPRWGQEACPSPRTPCLGDDTQEATYLLPGLDQLPLLVVRMLIPLPLQVTCLHLPGTLAVWWAHGETSIIWSLLLQPHLTCHLHWEHATRCTSIPCGFAHITCVWDFLPIRLLDNKYHTSQQLKAHPCSLPEEAAPQRPPPITQGLPFALQFWQEDPCLLPSSTCCSPSWGPGLGLCLKTA